MSKRAKFARRSQETSGSSKPTPTSGPTPASLQARVNIWSRPDFSVSQLPFCYAIGLLPRTVVLWYAADQR
jgi:hypothetical protein